jgi:ABC-type multidrug transport system ATPase subunit
MSAPVLNHVSGELPSAALTALMGPSGCGKSTLMGAVCGRVPAKNVSGRISFGDSIQRVGFVAQDDVLHRSLTVLENLYFSAHMRLPADTPNDVMREVVADVIKFLALFNVESREIGDAENKVLSGGQIRRVSIGMEMVADPDVLFLGCYPLFLCPPPLHPSFPSLEFEASILRHIR